MDITAKKAAVSPEPPSKKPLFDLSHNRWAAYFTQLAFCVALSLVIGSVIILLVGQDPLTVYSALIRQAFFTRLGLMIAIQRATPLIITSLAAVIAFKGGAINMGLEGQFMVGAAAAALAGYALPEMPKVITIPLIFLACGLAGAAAGWVPAFFKMVSGISEVITGMIANLIMPSLLSIVLSLPFLRAARSGVSREGLPAWAQLSQFAEMDGGGVGVGTRANTGIFIAIALAIALAIFFKRTRIGYEIRISSANFLFAEFAGLKARRSFYAAMMISGAIAGMAGATEVLGVWRGYSLNTIDVDYNGLLVALAGGNTFIGALLASFLFGGLQAGSLTASWSTPIPRPLIDVLVTILVVFAAIPSMRLFFSGSGFSDAERLGGTFTHKD